MRSIAGCGHVALNWWHEGLVKPVEVFLVGMPLSQLQSKVCQWLVQWKLLILLTFAIYVTHCMDRDMILMRLNHALCEYCLHMPVDLHRVILYSTVEA